MNSVERMYTSDPVAFAGAYLAYVQSILKGINTAEIGRFVTTLLEARAKGATIFFIGNGGSAATASHFANDLAIGCRDSELPFRAISLADNMSMITAIANDFGYEDVFARQLRVLAKSGDVLVAISASGNSPNLLKAFEQATALGLKTIAITAFDGGEMRKIADEGIHVPTQLKEYGPAEDAHMVLDHLVTTYLMRCVRIG